MSADHIGQTIHKKVIHFPNGNQALSVFPPHDADINAIISALDIKQPHALILIAGGAANLSEQFMAHLAQLFSHGVAHAAVQTQAMIIDGGTESGVMEIMGQGIAHHGNRTVLLGVAPKGLVTYPGGPVNSHDDSASLDPNHSHFVLVPSNSWGSETETMYRLAESLAESIAVVTIVVNGGGISKNEVMSSVRQGWPLLVIEGSGRLADDIVNQQRQGPTHIEDDGMREIIAKGNISLFPLQGSPKELSQRIIDMLITNTKPFDSNKH